MKEVFPTYLVRVERGDRRLWIRSLWWRCRGRCRCRHPSRWCRRWLVCWRKFCPTQSTKAGEERKPKTEIVIRMYLRYRVGNRYDVPKRCWLGRKRGGGQWPWRWRNETKNDCVWSHKRATCLNKGQSPSKRNGNEKENRMNEVQNGMENDAELRHSRAIWSWKKNHINATVWNLLTDKMGYVSLCFFVSMCPLVGL